MTPHSAEVSWHSENLLNLQELACKSTGNVVADCEKLAPMCQVTVNFAVRNLGTDADPDIQRVPTHLTCEADYLLKNAELMCRAFPSMPHCADQDALDKYQDDSGINRLSTAQASTHFRNRLHYFTCATKNLTDCRSLGTMCHVENNLCQPTGMISNRDLLCNAFPLMEACDTPGFFP
jgi:hypothetical protein